MADKFQVEVPFTPDLHFQMLLRQDSTTDADAIGYFTSEHLKMSGAYWTIGALTLLKKLDSEEAAQKREDIIKFIVACQHQHCGGFGGNIGHDPHISNTQYALLVLAMYDSVDRIDKDGVVSYVKSLQNPDGSFKGDYLGEVDTRFSYQAVSCLSLLNRLDEIDREACRDYVLKCQNPDGAFGGLPGAESHAAYVFTAVGTLKILGVEDLIDRDHLGLWLSQRQTAQGGFNGRPDKLADVCYSWWILSSCFMIGRHEWIDFEALRRFILNCQDTDEDQTGGGIADRPGNGSDVFHTYFGLAALSLMGKYELAEIDATYALPKKTMIQNFPHLVQQQDQ